MKHRLLIVPTLACIAGLTAAEPTAVAVDTITVQAEVEAPAVTGTKTETPPLLQPQSLGVIDAELMRDQHVVKLEDAIRNVAGVTIGGYYNDWDYFRIRGFDAGYNTRQDGLLASPGYWMTPETSGFERIEVLKGPASMLYGRSALGGMVNMVSKKPKHGDFATATVSAGTDDFGELGIDTGTTFADGEVGVRLVALGRNRGTHVEGVDDSQRLYIAPSLTWWGDHTTVTVLSHVQKDDINAAWPLPASGFITPNPNGDIPSDLNVGEPGFQNNVDNLRMAIGYELEHRFTDDLALRQNARVTRIDEDFQGIYPQALQADGRTLDRMVYTSEGEMTAAQVDTMLAARFGSGTVRHDALVGVDLAYDSQEFFGTYAGIAALDIFDPEYGAEPGAFTPYTDSKTDSRTIGLYLQDQMTVAEQLTITAGLRWDRIDTDDTENMTGTTTENSDSAMTWRVGAAYAFHPAVSVFASYATSFEPQPYSTSVDGGQVEPETGDQIEAGIRTIDPDGVFAATLAVYQITRRDVATEDLANPGFSVVSGEQQSRGVEIDTTLKPAAGMSLIATYSYIQAEVTEDNAIPVGDRLRGVPDHGVTTWAKYTLQDGTLAGLGFGLGGQWYSSQAGDLPNTFELPSYTVVEAGLFYDRGPLSAQLNVDNLLDEAYAIGSYNDLYVRPGDPLTVTGTVSYTF